MSGYELQLRRRRNYDKVKDPGVFKEKRKRVAKAVAPPVPAPIPGVPPGWTTVTSGAVTSGAVTFYPTIATTTTAAPAGTIMYYPAGNASLMAASTAPTVALANDDNLSTTYRLVLRTAP